MINEARIGDDCDGTRRTRGVRYGEVRHLQRPAVGPQYARASRGVALRRRGARHSAGRIRPRRFYVALRTADDDRNKMLLCCEPSEVPRGAPGIAGFELFLQRTFEPPHDGARTVL